MAGEATALTARPGVTQCRSAVFGADAHAEGVAGALSYPRTARSAGADRVGRAIGVGGRRLPAADRDPHDGPAVPAAAARPARPTALDAVDDRVRDLLVAVGEAHEHLVEHDVVEDLDGVVLVQPRGDPLREVAAAVDEVAEAGAAQRTQRRVERDPARAARELGCRLDVPRDVAVVGGEVVGGRRHRPALLVGVGDDRDPAVVGHVEPLVAVGRPRVGLAKAVDQVAARAADRRPQAERAVDVAPGAVRATGGDDRSERIARAAVDVTGLRAHDLRTVVLAHDRLQLRRDHPPGVVGRDGADALGAEAEDPAGAADRDVGVLARDDAYGRRSLQSVGPDVPAGDGEHGMAGRGQARDVRHLTAGHEADSAGGRQPEQLAHPVRRDALGDRERRRHHRAGAVPVPGRRQPVGGDGRGQRAAGDEAEVARSGGGDEAGIGVGGELGDDDPRILTRIGQRPPQPRAQLVAGGRRPDGPLREGGNEVAGEPSGVLEHVIAPIHPLQA